MTRTLATVLALLAVSAACPAWGATKAAKSLDRSAASPSRPEPAQARPAPTSTVVEAVARSGVDERSELRDLVAFDTHISADNWQAYAEQRAAVRACHAERYATARDNVLTGRSAPLRDC
jgi:hypothetical protein